MSATILFDLDGTLVETAPDLVATTNEIVSRKGFPTVRYEELRGIIGFGARAMLVEALTLHGIKLADDEIDQMNRDFIAHYAENIAVHSHVFPNLEDAMDQLAEDGHRFAVCTNKYEKLSRQLLDALNMSRRFSHIVGPDTLGVSKPDPKHVLGAIELAGGSPDRAIMIGDSPPDIDAARAANVPSIAVTFGYTAVPAHELGADAVISDYAELPATVAKLLA